MVLEYLFLGAALLGVSALTARARRVPEGAVAAVIVGLGLALISGFRYQYDGDFSRNVRVFRIAAGARLDELLDYADEPGAAIFRWALSKISVEPQIFFIATGLIICGSVVHLALRYSPRPVLSLFLFVALGPYFVAHNITVQYTAIAVLLWAIPAAVKRRLVPFLVLVALATSLHTSAMLFSLLYPLLRWRSSRGTIAAYVAGGALGVGLLWTILGFVTNYIYDQYESNAYGLEPASPASLLMPLFLAGYVIWAYPRLEHHGSKQNEDWLLSLVFHCGMLVLVFSVAAVLHALILIRLAEYFLAPLAVLLPALVEASPRRLGLKYAVLVGFASAYLLTRIATDTLIPSPYLLFWNA